MSEAKLNDSWHAVDGLSKREYFAAMAMQGRAQLFNFYMGRDETNRALRDEASRCVRIADALIEALNMPTPTKEGEK